MKRIILLIMILIFLTTGCSGLYIYDLSNFILPDDAEFIALVEELNTPEKIGKYMADNFETEEHPYITLTPYQLYITRKGDCDDFSYFARFMAKWHGYETYQILIFFPKPIYPVNTWHAIAVYREGNFFTVSENQWYWDWVRFNNFKSIMDVFNGWTKFIVYDHNMKIVETVYND